MTHASSAPNGCPSEFGLERLRLGELPPSDAEALSSHVQGCPGCSRRMDELQRPPRALDVEAVLMGARDGRVETGTRRSWFRAATARWTVALTAATAAAAVAILGLRSRPVPPSDLVKGSPWTLTVIVKRKGEQKVLRPASGVRLSAGDRLRFEVATTSASGYAAVIGADSHGVVAPLAPPVGDAVPVTVGRPVILDGAVELDDAPGSERIDLFGCARPVAVAELSRAVRRAVGQAAGDLGRVKEVAPGCHQETFWIEKVKP